jgi:SlyX protein
MDKSKADSEARLEARIVELESRFAEQDQTMLELSDELYRQQRQIAALLAQLEQVTGRLDALATRTPAGDAGHEVPPHY